MRDPQAGGPLPGAVGEAGGLRGPVQVHGPGAAQRPPADHRPAPGPGPLRLPVQNRGQQRGPQSGPVLHERPQEGQEEGR